MATRKATAATEADRDDEIKAAHDAEIQRQRDQENAVREANASELPNLGGPELNPGNPNLESEG